MILEYDKSFDKSLDKIKDKNILSRIENILIKTESAKSIEDIPNTKKLIGFAKYFRIKIGDFLTGIRKNRC